VAIGCALFLGAPANADDPTPRAIPAGRALPRTFSSYDAVVSYATGVAADESALDLRLAAVRADSGALAETTDVRLSHGRLLILARLEQELIAAGALTADARAWVMPTAGEITQPFGPTPLRVEPPRVYGGVAYAHFHDGVDIAGPWMADIVAPARGRVVFVGRMADGAEIVVLAHDGGIVTMYAHLDAYASPPTVAAGDEVAAGQKIGTVGMTGISYGMHLHWAAWRNGELIDPMSLVGK